MRISRGSFLLCFVVRCTYSLSTRKVSSAVTSAIFSVPPPPAFPSTVVVYVCKSEGQKENSTASIQTITNESVPKHKATGKARRDATSSEAANASVRTIEISFCREPPIPTATDSAPIVQKRVNDKDINIKIPKGYEDTLKGDRLEVAQWTCVTQPAEERNSVLKELRNHVTSLHQQGEAHVVQWVHNHQGAVIWLHIVTSRWRVIELVTKAKGVFAGCTCDVLRYEGPPPYEVTDPTDQKNNKKNSGIGMRSVLQNRSAIARPGHWTLNPLSQPRGKKPIDNYWCHESEGEGVDIYMIDTGCDISHSEFAGIVNWGLIVSDPSLPTAMADYGHGQGAKRYHGTQVMSKAVGAIFGTARRARPIVVIALDKAANEMTCFRIIAALEQIIVEVERDRQVRGDSYTAIINTSLSYVPRTPKEMPSLQQRTLQDIYIFRYYEAFQKLSSLEYVIITVATGNKDADWPIDSYPAVFGSSSLYGFKNVVLVGAVAGDGRGIFQTSKDVKINALGWMLPVPAPASTWETNSGTSFAAPQVAGLLATLITKKRLKAWDAIDEAYKLAYSRVPPEYADNPRVAAIYPPVAFNDDAPQNESKDESDRAGSTWNIPEKPEYVEPLGPEDTSDIPETSPSDRLDDSIEETEVEYVDVCEEGGVPLGDYALHLRHLNPGLEKRSEDKTIASQNSSNRITSTVTMTRNACVGRPTISIESRPPVTEPLFTFDQKDCERCRNGETIGGVIYIMADCPCG